MNVAGTHYRTIWIDSNDTLLVIDQRALPHRFVIVPLQSFTQVCEAVTSMLVRGAGLIGATAGYGMWLAAQEWNALHAPASPGEGVPIPEACDQKALRSFDLAMQKAGQTLKSTRPTATNLAVAVDRQLAAMGRQSTLSAKKKEARRTAETIADEDATFCQRIGAHGLPLIKTLAQRKKATASNPVNILTHCNAGWLAFVDYGSALAPVYAAHDAGIPVHIWVDETRPRNQGALTAWELLQHGVPHSLIADNAGGHLMQHGLVDMVITGADRVTRHGDAANKIGTYLKALAAHDNNIPLYIALPSSTFDFAMGDGVCEIPIEERNPDEVRILIGKAPTGEIIPIQICPDETPARNWAFDVTPARLITGLICERGVCDPSEAAILALYPEALAAQPVAPAAQLPPPHADSLPKDGVIKYTAHHLSHPAPACLGTSEARATIAALDEARTQLHDLGLVGCTAEGIGFGNLSQRLSDKTFIITGSGTGDMRVLGANGYCLVREAQAGRNQVFSEGPVRASSESMTHGVIYKACPQAQCVIHIHDKSLFDALLAHNWPHTPAHVPYGTPELAHEVVRLLHQYPSTQGLFVTAGHDSGIFVYGETLTAALHLLLEILYQHSTL